MTFTPNFLSQQDPRWKDHQLGFDSSITIGTDGCAITSLTMLVNGYGFSETPESVNNKLVAMGAGAGFIGGMVVWGAITRAFPAIVYRDRVIWNDQPASLSGIDAALSSGQPVVVQLDHSPSPGLQNHWVVLVAKQDSDYLMLDPWPYPQGDQPLSLSSKYGFGRSPEQVITAAVWYDAIGSSTASVPTDGLYVRVPLSLSAGLNLRAQPNVSASILGKEQAGTYLRCLEPDSVAVPKIGQQNQWLQVRDPAGLTGYVAAWYVESSGAVTPTTTTPTTTTPTTTTPTTTTPTTTTPTTTTPTTTIPTTTTPTTTTPSALTVTVMQSVGTSGLRLRSQPSMTGTLVAIEADGATLNVIEAADQAQAKIGVTGKWINVKDSRGLTGYVAAWFVQLSGSTVKVMAAVGPAGLRLRDGPSTSANVLKVLPVSTVLTPLESTAGKIGVTGYVAAWFVE
jgi:hypothetical protein